MIDNHKASVNGRLGAELDILLPVAVCAVKAGMADELQRLADEAGQGELAALIRRMQADFGNLVTDADRAAWKAKAEELRAFLLERAPQRPVKAEPKTRDATKPTLDQRVLAVLIELAAARGWCATTLHDATHSLGLKLTAHDRSIIDASIFTKAFRAAGDAEKAIRARVMDETSSGIENDLRHRLAAGDDSAVKLLNLANQALKLNWPTKPTTAAVAHRMERVSEIYGSSGIAPDLLEVAQGLVLIDAYVAKRWFEPDDARATVAMAQRLRATLASTRPE